MMLDRSNPSTQPTARLLAYIAFFLYLWISSKPSFLTIFQAGGKSSRGRNSRVKLSSRFVHDARAFSQNMCAENQSLHPVET